jgi:hypothetical protein
MKYRMMKIIPVALVFQQFTNASTGYYIGGAVQLNRQFMQPQLKKFTPGDDKVSRFGADIVVGYMYSCTVSVGGQITFGYGGKDLKHAEKITEKVNGGELHITPDIIMRNRFRCGAEVLAGMSFGSVIRTFIYGMCGCFVNTMQMRGSIFAEQGANKAVTYFGKDAATIHGIPMQKVAPLHKFIPTWSVGAGMRVYLFGRVFVGVEGRYFVKRKRGLKMKCAKVDQVGLLGEVVTPVTEKKVEVPTRFGHFSVGGVVGIHI